MEGGKLEKGGTQLKDIFKAPLEAVVEAEIDLTNKIQTFIATYGFSGVGDEGFADENSKLELKTVKIKYFIGGKQKTLSVPVLSLVPLPLLTIKDAEFDLNVSLMSAMQPPQKSDGEENELDQKPNKQLIAYIPPDSKSTSGKVTESMGINMKVKLKMQEGDIPIGLMKLYSFMDQLIADEPDDETIHDAEVIEEPEKGND